MRKNGVWLALFELARAGAVVAGERHVGRALGGALRVLRRRPWPVMLFFGLALGVLGLSHALFRWGLTPVLPLDWWLLVLVVQQAFVVLRLALRLWRLGGEVALVGQPAAVSAAAQMGGDAV